MSKRIHCDSRLFPALALVATLAGCNGSSSSGTLNLSVTDTPVDGAQSVVVAFTGVDIMGPGGQQSFSFSPEHSVDVQKLQGNASTNLLAGVNVPAGSYQWVRLDIDAANSYIITSTGAKFPLRIPGESESGLKLVSGFTVGAGNVADLMIDFDLRRSVIQSDMGGVTVYTLEPGLRLVDQQQVGSISGTVSASLSIGGALITAPTCSPAVYVYRGTGVPIGYNFPEVAVMGSERPFASATVSLDAASGTYTYAVGFLAQGTYTVAAACASADTSTNSSSLAFSLAGTQTAVVTANNTTLVNF